MECGTMHFGEFNPLEVLAAAASLQTPGRNEGRNQDSPSDGEGDPEDGGEDGIDCEDNVLVSSFDKVKSESTTTAKGQTVQGAGCQGKPSGKFISPGGAAPCSTRPAPDRGTMPRVVKVVNSNGGVTNKVVSNCRSIIALKDASTKMTVTTNPKDGASKTLTVLRINKTLNADHSYAVYAKLDRSRMEEDEGYCSRSSLGSPGQCWKSDSEMTDPDVFDGRDIECDPKSPYVVLPSGQTVNCLSPTISAGSSSEMKSPTGVLPKTAMSPPLPVVQGINSDKSVTVESQNRNSANRKHTKIVIVSRDANLRKYFGGDTETSESKSPEAKQSSKQNETVKIVSPQASGEPNVVTLVPPSTDSNPETPAVPEELVCDKRLDEQSGLLETCVDCEQLREDDNKKTHPTRTTGSGVDTDPVEPVVQTDSGPASVEKDMDINVVESVGECDSGIVSVDNTSKCDNTVSSDEEKITNKCVPGEADLAKISLKCVQDPGKVKVVESHVESGNKEKSCDLDLQCLESLDKHVALSVSSESGESELLTPVSSLTTPGNDSVAVSSHANITSCPSKNREHSVIHKPRLEPATADTTKVAGSTVLPLGEQKSQQNGSHKVLHGLLAAGSSTKPTQTVLLPGGQLCRLQSNPGSSDMAAKSMLSGLKFCSPTANFNSKGSVMYLVSSAATKVTAGATAGTFTAARISNSASASPTSNPCNKYIIQDDVPPLSKYSASALQQTKTIVSPSVNTFPRVPEPGKKLGAVQQPKLVTGAKDSFVLLRPGSSGPRPIKSNLVAVNPSMKSLVPGSCVVPVLFSGSSPAPRSLLPLASKNSLVALQKQQIGVNVTTVVTPNPVDGSSPSVTNAGFCLLQSESGAVSSQSSTNCTTAIPRSRSSSLLSSHKLSPSSSLVAIAAELDEPSRESDTKSIESASTSDTDTCPTPNLSDMNDHKDDLNDLYNDSSLFDEPRDSECMTPVTPTSGRTTPAYEGRMTPLGFSSASSCDSTPSPGGKINIKISGGVVVDVRQEKNSRDINNKAARSIGQVGSLTWQNMSCPSPGSATVPPGSTSRTTPTYTGKTKTTRVKKETPVATSTNKEETVDKKKRSKARKDVPSRAELYRMKESAQNMSELHPLIDHDYCTFTEFTADIQSSIIATTESKLKKSKTARPKYIIQPAPASQTKVDTKLKKRKYTKRKLTHMLERSKEEYIVGSGLGVDALEDDDDYDEDDQPSTSMDSDYTTLSQLPKDHLYRDRKPKRRYRPRNCGDKNYVKIPGCYQDQFVYYATKKKRGGPRKFHDDKIQLQIQATKQSAANINEFEWYKEMARIDKSMKFGVAGVGMNSVVKPANVQSYPKSADTETATTGATPLHESEVVDMVIDMMPSSGLNVTTMDSSKIYGALIEEDGQKLAHSHGSTVSLASIHSEDSNASTIKEEVVESSEAGTVDPGVMAEFNRLLNSMEESDQLKILANLNMAEGQSVDNKHDKDSNVLIKDDGEATLTNLNAYLGSYNSGPNNPNATPSHSQFLDLDDINDNDLLNTSELGNIFGDLTTSSVTATSTTLGAMSSAGDSPSKLPSAEYSTFGENSCSSYSMDSTTMELPSGSSHTQHRDAQPALGKPLDELFPDISSAVPQVSSENGVPDLTLVQMYWNELPGLLINGVEHVRLVDIHKQVLPAKDTGILKKRCQMMGLEIMNCSDLQRDFLIRYMNAAKSKSCVIVAKEAAKTLIGFYVDPRPRIINRNSAENMLSARAKVESKLKVLLPTQRSEDLSCDEGSDAHVDLEDGVTTTDSPAKMVKPRVTSASKSGKQRTPRPKSSSPAPEGTQTSVAMTLRTELSQRDIKRSARLMNKKVPYAALHSGSWAGEEETESEAASTKDANVVTDGTVELSTPELEVLNDENMESVSVVNVTSSGKSLSRPRRPIIMDEMELRKLMTKQKQRKLNPKERRRIRRLREKIRKHELRCHQDEVHRQHERREKWLKNLEKAKCRRLEKKALTDKHNQEHCYAASQEPLAENVESVSANVIPVKEARDSNEDVTCPLVVDSGVVKVSEPAPEVVELDNAPSPDKPTPTDIKPKMRTRTPKATKSEPQHKLQVLHMDNVQRGQRSRTQDGTLHMGRYQSREATCIECNTCQEMLSIRRFLKHRHHLNNPDELVEVSLPQKLELLMPPQDAPGSEQVNLWAQFTQKRQTFATTTPKRRDRSKAKQSQSPKVKTTNIPVPRVLSTTPSGTLADSGQRDDAACGTIPSTPETTPDDGARHSGRVRKRKQLHPMESYVFGNSPPQGQPDTKRPRRGARSRDGLG